MKNSDVVISLIMAVGTKRCVLPVTCVSVDDVYHLCLSNMCATLSGPQPASDLCSHSQPIFCRFHFTVTVHETEMAENVLAMRD